MDGAAPPLAAARFVATRFVATRFVAIGVALSGIVACARPPILAPAAPAPVMDRPASAIPADLDVAIRLDLDAARRLFGPTVAQALKLEIVDPARDAKTAALLTDALARADVAYAAFRPGLAARLTDNVIVLRGAFASIDPPREGEGAWGPPADLGGGFRLHERPAPERRSAPSRLYARGNDWLVFVSEAEVDAAERSIERRAGDLHLDPKEGGIVSLSARVPPLLPFLTPGYPAVAQALGAAVQLDATADADDRGLRAAFEVRYETDADAGDGLQRLQPLLTALQRARGGLGRLARGADAAVLGPVLVVRITLDGPGLAALMGCFDHPGEC